MAQCSICVNAEVAQTVNELLYAKQGLDEIAQATGCHRSSVHRHKSKCFLAWKAARIKAKSGRVDTSSGRMLVSWPAGYGPHGPRDERDGELCTHGEQPFDLAKRQHNDVLLRIVFEPLPERVTQIADALAREKQECSASVPTESTEHSPETPAQ